MDMNIGGTQVHPLTEYPEFCKPIPLTEEWLLKFGYKLYHDYVWVNDNTDVLGRIDKFKDDVARSIYPRLEIKYVHQLQNLYFALTGKELTYEK